MVSFAQVGAREVSGVSVLRGKDTPRSEEDTGGQPEGGTKWGGIRYELSIRESVMAKDRK